MFCFYERVEFLDQKRLGKQNLKLHICLWYAYTMESGLKNDSLIILSHTYLLEVASDTKLLLKGLQTALKNLFCM